MKLVNSTDIPDDLAREMIRFVCPPGVTKFDVMLKNSQYHWGGRAYTYGSSYHGQRGWFVVCRIGAAKMFPYIHKQEPGRGYLGWGRIHSREEALVLLIAHELRHLWQRKHPRGYRVWGSRGQFSERDTDAYAIRKLREWRRTHLPKEVPLAERLERFKANRPAEIPPAKPEINRKEEHARAMLKRAMRRFNLAKTIATKWKRRVARYEKRAARH